MNIDTPIGRTVQRVAGSAWFAKVGPKVVPHVDRVLHRLTGGRVLVSAALLPSLMLTTTGAKSGLPRQVPLATMPDGDAFVVVASNFGQAHHPAWSANLMANPHATAVHRGQQITVTARLLGPDEKVALWPRLCTFWPVYNRYTERSGRDLRVFRLERSAPR